MLTNEYLFSLDYYYTGLVGRNGTGKTTFLRYMAMHAIEGIPANCQILHVEQEVVGDNTTALQCVLNTDIERAKLLEEETQILAKQVSYKLLLLIEESLPLGISILTPLCPFSPVSSVFGCTVVYVLVI